MILVLCTIFRPNPEQINMQAVLMDLFFENIDPNSLEKISHGNTTKHFEKWEFQPSFNIELDFQAVTYVRICCKKVGNFRIDYLPNSVERLMILDCEQSGTVKTRLFPRNLVFINLRENALYGTIDLQTLPEKLEHLELGNNQLTGPIYLFRIPKTMNVLSLSNNAIKQETIFYDDLPNHMSSLSLIGNEIGKIQCTDTTEATPLFLQI